MIAFLPIDAVSLATYAIAAVVLTLAPGPGQALIVARTIQGGRRAGLMTALGLEVGTVVHTIAAALGLSAVLATSATAFAVVKYAGALYLVVLGVVTLRRARATQAAAATGEAPTDSTTLLLHGAAAGTFNPKVAIFFLAFLPQFVRPDLGNVLAQFVILGLVLAIIGLLFDSAIALLVSQASNRFGANPALAVWRERLMGTVLVALGGQLALMDAKS